MVCLALTPVLSLSTLSFSRMCSIRDDHCRYHYCSRPQLRRPAILTSHPILSPPHTTRRRYHFYSRPQLRRCLRAKNISHIHLHGDSMSRDFYALVTRYLGTDLLLPFFSWPFL
jgi:hypothetical protein